MIRLRTILIIEKISFNNPTFEKITRDEQIFDEVRKKAMVEVEGIGITPLRMTLFQSRFP